MGSFSKRAVGRNVVALIVVVIVVAASVAGYFALNQPSSSGVSTTASGYKDTVVVGTTDSIASNLDPAVATGTWPALGIIFNVCNNLVSAQPNNPNVILPDVATSWTVSPDGLTYTFQLRHDVKYSNGDPLTAQDVIFNYQRAAYLQGGESYLITSEFNATDPGSFYAPDAYTVVIKLYRPFAPFLAELALSDNPFFLVDPKTVNATEIFSGAPIGAGPYMITNWIHGVELDLQANPYYFGTPPLTKNVIIKFFSDASTLALAVSSGQVDLAYRQMSPATYKTLATYPSLRIWRGVGVAPHYIQFNLHIPPFDNVKVRQAVAYAVDRTAILNSVYLDTATPAYSLVAPSLVGSTDSYRKIFGSDGNIAMAKQLLTEAGYSPTNKLQIEYYFSSGHYGPTEQALATILKQQIEATGMVSVNLHNVEWGTFTYMWFHTKSIPMCTLTWYPDYVDADDFLASMFYSPFSAGLSIYYNNTKVDQLTMVEQATTDNATRIPALEQIQAITANDAAIIPLYIEVPIVVSQNTVSGVILDASIMMRFWTIQVQA